MTIQEQLNKEIEEFNELNQRANQIEREKLHKMGRITVLQELLEEEKSE